MATAEMRLLTPPLADRDILGLRAGDQVRFSRVLLTARDAAHKRLVAGIDAGQSLPIDLYGQVLYYVGPTPPRPGMVIGAAGPTTGGRMDAYASKLMALGLKGMIGKGGRSRAVREAMQQHGCVYFGAVGGPGRSCPNIFGARRSWPTRIWVRKRFDAWLSRISPVSSSMMSMETICMKTGVEPTRAE